MFNTLKKLFGKRVEEAGVTTVDRPASPGAKASSRSPFAGSRSTAPAQAAVDSQPRQTSPATTGSRLSLPMKTVIAKLPPELAGRVRQTDVGDSEIFVPIQKVLTQLPTGAVRLSFGELRQASPPGTFSPENDRDRTMVDLPLPEILARVNPGSIARRPAQKVIEVPPEVTGPFSGQTRVTISTTPPLKSGEAAKSAAPAQDAAKRNGHSAAPAAPIPVARQAPVAPVAPVVPAQPEAPAPIPMAEPVGEQPIFRRTTTPTSQPVPQAPRPAVAPTPAPAPAVEPEAEQPIFKRATPPAPAQPVAAPIVPTAPPAQAAVPPSDPDAIPISAALRNLAGQKPAAPQPQPAPAPAAPVEQPAPIKFNPSAMPTPAAPAPVAPIAFTPPAPAPAEPVVPATPAETRFISVPLIDLSQTWPDVVKPEVDQINKPGTMVALPFGMVEAAMKAGKLAFPWVLIRSWIRPAVPSVASAHDAVLLELSLKLVTPLFMAELKVPRPTKRVTVAAEIPDLFSNGSRPQVVTPPPQSTVPAVVDVTQQAKSLETNYYHKDEAENPNDPALQVKKGAKIGTSFLQRYATPNDIVAKAAILPGVGGALIALPDGLLVSSKVPADMNADTLAGFLPAIFSKVSQTTKELRMGELNNLNFTVGNVPWKIFRVGAIYFAAFGVAGRPMPTAQLAELAAELDRKPKQ